MPLPLYYHRLYTDGLHPDVRFPRDRYAKLRAALSEKSIDRRADIRESPLAAREDLELVHTHRYVEDFLTQQLDRSVARRIGLRPWTPEIVDRTLRILGGSVAALHALFREEAGAAGNLAGGTHHAFAHEGAGYCVFNDLAVAARVAQRDHAVTRIGILDLDVHQGDGTAAIFREDPSIFTTSVHCAVNFPFRKQTSDFDLALEAGSTDGAYLEATHKSLEAIIARQPELVIFQAGVDALAADHLGKLSVTQGGLRKRNQLVFEATRAAKVPILILMGGGYARPIEHTVDAFVDLFEAAADAFP